MKRIFALLLLQALLLSMVLPVCADDNNHQMAQVLEITEGTQETTVYKMYHLQDAEMMEIFTAFRETEEAKEILPEGMEIKHLTMIRQRDVVNNGEPIRLSLRAWGAENRYLVVFFKPVGEEEWAIVAAARDEFIDVELPGDGQYAFAWSWG